MFQFFPGYNATPELAMQLPMYGYATPFAPDWNQDGILDLWHHNHYVFSNDDSRWSDPSVRRLGPGRVTGGCMVDWDAVLFDGIDTWRPANSDGKGWIEWADAKKPKCFDVHSTTILDIDGDGVLDLYLTTGGGRGRGKSFEYDNLIFWGTRVNSTLGFKLVGGRDAAYEAGLHGRTQTTNLNGRGRHQYWLDVNGDGQLDVLALNQERSDRLFVPSQLNVNKDGRNFVTPPNDFDDIAAMALMTDIDGDGLARELLVMSECDKPDPRRKPNTSCARAPTGTASVYRLDPERYLVRESVHPQQLDFATAIATADFDQDGLADVAIQWDKSISFHLSSFRQKKCNAISNDADRKRCLLTIGPRDDVLDLKPICGTQLPSASMRFADFNLDGKLDLLVVCATPGRHAILEQTPSNGWRRIQNPRGKTLSMGSLRATRLMRGGKGFCKDIPTTTDAVSVKTRCESKFDKEQCQNVRYTIQFVLCSQYAKKKNKPTALAVGATVADLDNDGFVDVILGHRFGSTLMFRNTLGDWGNKNNFLAVRIDKNAGAAAAIGAIVKLKAKKMGPDRNQKTTQLRVVSSLSHLADADGGSEDRLIFGLGRAGIPLKLTIQWPHCCKATIIWGPRLKQFLNSMDKPFIAPAPPKNCDTSCL